MKWYQKLGVGIILVGVIFICLNLIPLKYNINSNVTGVKWEFDNQEVQESVTIVIDGVYTKYILHFLNKSDYFEGDFSVSGYEFTDSADSFLFRVNFNDKLYNMGSLNFGGGTDGLESHILGTIYAENQLSQGVILLNDSLVVSENQQVISFPCEDRTQAVSMAKEMLPEGFVFE